MFVLIVQSFQKIACLKALAPTQSEPPFQIAQAAALVLIVVLAAPRGAEIPADGGVAVRAISAIIRAVAKLSPAGLTRGGSRMEGQSCCISSRMLPAPQRWPSADRRCAAAQDCPRGDLDKAYCDRNGDMVADAPADPKQLINPSTLIFAYTPVEDPALYTKVWDGFLRHLEKVTGKKVVFFPVQSNAAEIEAMRSGRLHIAGVSTGPTPIAVNCAGYVPFAIMGTKERHLRLRDGNHRAGRQPDQDAGRPQGQEARVHRADLELRLQGAVGDPEVRIQSHGRARLHAGVLRQARQLGARRRQQGL